MSANEELDVLRMTLEGKEGVQLEKLVLSGSASWPRPIPVSERLPASQKWPPEQYVLAYVPEYNGAWDDWFKAAYCEGHWTDDSRDGCALPLVTHWLPLLPKPTE